MVVQPSSGTLELGQSTTMRVSGQYDSDLAPAGFWIVVQAPDPNWTARVMPHFRCAGR